MAGFKPVSCAEGLGFPLYPETELAELDAGNWGEAGGGVEQLWV